MERLLQKRLYFNTRHRIIIPFLFLEEAFTNVTESTSAIEEETETEMETETKNETESLVEENSTWDGITT